MTEFEILALITLVAAAVTGAVGYGFSSLTVPVALLFFPNKVLNPALVCVAIVLNGYVLALNRRDLPRVWRRVAPVMLALVPGIIGGSYVLANLNPEWLKLTTYLMLLPLILLQAGGIRRPIKSERALAVPLGTGVGLLYSVTTISGPPLALLFNNQGLVQGEFRAAMALIRVFESVLAAIAYYFLGVYSAASGELFFWILPGVLLGVPLGSFLIKRANSETFRRFCMSYDAWIVGFGLSRVLIVLQLLAAPAAYGVWLSVAAIDAYLLYVYFRRSQAITVNTAR
jgi:uncharacterized membrane protein YfcA